MANPQILKEYETEPFRMRALRGFCNDPKVYATYLNQYREIFNEVWIAVEKGELTPQEGVDLMKECRNVSPWP